MVHARSLRPAARVSLFVACTSASSTGIPPVECPPGGSTLTYENFGRELIDTGCLECHTTKERPHLTTQADVQRYAASILDEAVYTDAMPEGRDMALATREQLGEWLACGAP